METIDLNSWDEFEIQALDSVKTWIDAGSLSYSDQPLFRGHSDSSWTLQTTLERYTNREISMEDYDNDMRSASRMVETVIDRKMGFPDTTEGYLPLMPTPNSGAMTWLRQNGFPSPLLDWSQSPYVAAYFAFSGVNPDNTDRISVYKYVETETGMRSGGSGNPTITCLGPWIPSDKKHFLQQSRYTMCVVNRGGGYVFASHEDGFSTSGEDQNHLVKYTIPASEKEKTLRLLKVMNITEYSLFETTKGLLSNLALDLYING